MLCIFTTIATDIQNNNLIFNKDPKKRIFLILCAANFLYYIVSIYCGFEAYKEFKSVHMTILKGDNKWKIGRNLKANEILALDVTKNSPTKSLLPIKEATKMEMVFTNQK